MESMSSLELDSGLLIILPKAAGANIHDGVATIDLVGELVKQGYRIRYSVFDSTYDNYQPHRIANFGMNFTEKETSVKDPLRQRR